MTNEIAMRLIILLIDLLHGQCVVALVTSLIFVSSLVVVDV